jgi:hypothetical protein
MHELDATPEAIAARAHLTNDMSTLSNLLYNEALHLPMNRSNHVTVTYHILENDPVLARAEFSSLHHYLYHGFDHSAYMSTPDSFIETYEDGQRHHGVSVKMPNGRVAYQVLWIEKTGDTEDE